MEEKPRILVIGSTGHSREVTCVGWRGTIPNVADYEAVFIDLTPLNHEYALPDPTYYETLPTRDSFVKLLESDGEVWVIAVPPVSRQWEDGLTWSNYEWCPILPNLCFENGQTIKNVEDPYDAYFAHLKKWSFYFEEEMDTSFLHDWYDLDATKVPALSRVEIKTFPLAENRYDKPLGIGVRYTVYKGYYSRGTKYSGAEEIPGRMYFLHPPSEIPSKEAIDILLRDLYGIGIREPEPEWASRLKVPKQDVLQEKVGEAKAIIEAEQDKIDVASTDLAHRREFVELLYQKGERLEELVLGALEDLEAGVTRNPIKNEEDGWIATPFGDGVLEITSSKGSASLDDVRQLDDWTFRGKEKGKEYKPILIGNYYCETPVPQRLHEKPFPSNVVEEAVKRDQCLLTTQQLFEAHCAVQEDTDGKAFLEKMMKTAGPCTLVEKPKWSV